MTKRIDRIDKQVGANLRKLREYRHRTQEELGNAMGVAFQQVQKYEAGKNRISASRLVKAARFLEEPLHCFFVGVDLPRESRPN